MTAVEYPLLFCEAAKYMTWITACRRPAASGRYYSERVFDRKSIQVNASIYTKRSDQVRRLRVRGAEQIRRSQLDLETDFAGADTHGREPFCGPVNECGEMLLHSDG